MSAICSAVSTFAGLLRVQLVKKDVYVLGDALEPLTLDKIDSARRMTAGSATTTTSSAPA